MSSFHICGKNKQLYTLFSRIAAEGIHQSLGCEHVRCPSMPMKRYCTNVTPNERQARSNSRKPQPTRAIRTANECILRHINTNFSVVDLAKGCGYNQDYQCRTIKNAFGISVIQYVNHLRFEQANLLMEHTDISPEYCNCVRNRVRIDY